MGISTITSVSCDFPECDEASEGFQSLKGGKPLTFPPGWKNVDIYFNGADDRDDAWDGILCPDHARAFTG